MTAEQKNLLLKDFSGRLPYGVKISVNDKVETLQGINILDNVVEYDSYLSSDIEEVKPYLFPLSSMTEEQKTFFDDKHIDIDDILGIVAIFAHVNCEEWIEIIDWLNKNHFDYRGLIPMELNLQRHLRNYQIKKNNIFIVW